jgi:hypothetical protein
MMIATNIMTTMMMIMMTIMGEIMMLYISESKHNVPAS